MAVISVQQNDVVRKISGWAAIIAVPTLIASVYGMNFDHMPELGWTVGYPGGPDRDDPDRACPVRLLQARALALDTNS